jgi:hypothetical protein
LAARPADDLRQCPTRASGAPALIAHWITPATCLERQRASYHKCFTCQYRGLGAGVALPKPAPAEERAPAPAPPAPRIARSKIAKVSKAV